jgi:hypothetical protein
MNSWTNEPKKTTGWRTVCSYVDNEMEVQGQRKCSNTKKSDNKAVVWEFTR